MSAKSINRRGFLDSIAATIPLTAAVLTLPAEMHAREKGMSMKSEKLTGKASIRIHRSPSEVFAAFADASSMSKFWFTRRDDGLEVVKSVLWFLGSDRNAVSFEVRVMELELHRKIVIEWENGGELTQVAWSFEAADNGDTILTIEETGFTGNRQSIIERAINSTGGFNQVIIAAKALVEHGVELNVVADHA